MKENGMDGSDQALGMNLFKHEGAKYIILDMSPCSDTKWKFFDKNYSNFS